MMFFVCLILFDDVVVLMLVYNGYDDVVWIFVLFCEDVFVYVLIVDDGSMLLIVVFDLLGLLIDVLCMFWNGGIECVLVVGIDVFVVCGFCYVVCIDVGDFVVL